MIEINNLSKVFRTSEVETVALNRVNLEVKEGEFVASWGPQGAVNPPCSTSSVCWIIPQKAAIGSWVRK